jgi:hypothetical protein
MTVYDQTLADETRRSAVRTLPSKGIPGIPVPTPHAAEGVANTAQHTVYMESLTAKGTTNRLWR